MSALKIWREAGKNLIEKKKKEFSLYKNFLKLYSLSKNTDDIPAPSEEIVEDARIKWRKSYKEMSNAQKYYNSLPYPEICNETGEILAA